MVKAIITDVSRVLLFPKDKNYKGSLNNLYRSEINKLDFKFFDYFRLNMKLLNFYKSQSNKVKLYILTSDVIQDASDLKPFWDNVIDGIFSASKMNTDKSTAKAYQKVIHQLGLVGNEIIYIDDNFKNLQAARKVGLQTVLYQNNLQTISDIKKILEEK